MEQTKKKQITVGYNYVKINFYSLNISSFQWLGLSWQLIDY